MATSKVARKTRKARKKAPPVIEESLSLGPECSNCREPLTRVAWNTLVDILICENLSCTRYLQPQGSIPVPFRTMAQMLGKPTTRISRR